MRILHIALYIYQYFVCYVLKLPLGDIFKNMSHSWVTLMVQGDALFCWVESNTHIFRGRVPSSRRSLGLVGLWCSVVLNSSDFQIGKGEREGRGVRNSMMRRRDPASPVPLLGFILRKSDCSAICFLVRDLVIPYHFFFFFFSTAELLLFLLLNWDSFEYDMTFGLSDCL